MVLHHEGFPIRKSAGRSLFAAHRSLSQLVASFIGSWCQGIHLMLLFAWTYLMLVLLFTNCLSFIKQIIDFGYSLFQWKGFILFVDWFPPFGEIVIYPNLERPFWFSCFSLNLICPLICSFLTLQYSLFGFQWTYPRIFIRFLTTLSLTSTFEVFVRSSFVDIGSGNLPVVGSSGLEPPTSRLSGARSNHLSYEPM